MKILFYGRLADAIGREVELQVASGTSVGSLRERLAEEHPAVAQALRSTRALACVDGVLVRGDQVVTADQLVEFLPPVSGG